MAIEEKLLEPMRRKRQANKSKGCCPNPLPMLEIERNNNSGESGRPVSLIVSSGNDEYLAVGGVPFGRDVLAVVPIGDALSDAREYGHPETPNVEVQGRCAVSSRSVPCNDGLGVGSHLANENDSPPLDVASADDGRTDGAPKVVITIGLPELENNFSPIVEARLADVMRRLRSAWLAGPALCWGDVHSVCPLATTDVDKRVSTALRDGFFSFSQFLCGLEQLLLEFKQLGVVREQSILSLEQLIVHPRNLCGDEIPVAHSESTTSNVFGSFDRGDCSRDETEVHISKTPNVELTRAAHAPCSTGGGAC